MLGDNAYYKDNNWTNKVFLIFNVKDLRSVATLLQVRATER